MDILNDFVLPRYRYCYDRHLLCLLLSQINSLTIIAVCYCSRYKEEYKETMFLMVLFVMSKGYICLFAWALSQSPFHQIIWYGGMEHKHL